MGVSPASANSELHFRLAEIGIGKRFYDAKLIKIVSPVVEAKLRVYVGGIIENLKIGRGIVFIGPNGVGKTSLLSIIAKAAITNEKEFKERLDIKYASAFDLCDYLVDQSDGARFISKAWLNCHLMLVDDLGWEYAHDWPLGALLNFFDKRYANAKATCMATNIPFSQFADKTSAESKKYRKLLDRWNEESAFQIIEIDTPSQRK